MKITGIKFADGEKVILSQKPKRSVYRCSACGEAFVWDIESCWYGSWGDVEDYNWTKIEFFCSDQCKWTWRMKNRRQ